MIRYLLALPILIATFGEPAQADTLTTMLSKSGLTQADILLMSEKAAILYSRPNVSVGDKISWENTDSSARGTVEISQREGDCIIIRHVFETSASSAPMPMRFRRCKAADGSWQQM